MAAIHNSIDLTDRMSPVLRRVLRALDSTMRAMDQLDRATNRGMNSDAFRLAQRDIQSANRALNSLNGNLGDTEKRLNRLGNMGGVFSNLGNSASKFIISLDHGLNILERISDKIGGMLKTADEARSQVARIGLYNKSAYSNEQLYGQIFATAMATRSGLFETGDLVNKLLMSGVFKGDNAPTAAIGMAGIINKALIAGGGIAEDNKRALRQLNQALSSGILQGDELRSIREQAPYLAQVLSKGLAKIDDKFIGTTVGDLKELGAQGELTADRVVKAFWAMQDEINKDFKNMPKTFGQAMESISNIWKYFLYLISGVDGPLGKINDKLWQLVDYLQSTEGIEFLNDLAIGINFVCTAIAGAMQMVGDFVTFLQNNVPVAQALFIALGTTAVSAGVASFIAWLQVAWPILLVMAAVFAISYAFLQAGYTAQEVIGTMVGIVCAAAGVVWDILIATAAVLMWVGGVTIIAVIAAGAAVILVIQGVFQLIIWVVMAVITIFWFLLTVIESVFLGGKAAVQSFCIDVVGQFHRLAQDVLSILALIASGIDAVFGSSLADTVFGWSSTLEGKFTAFVQKNDPTKTTDEIKNKWEEFGSGVKTMFSSDKYNLYDEMGNVAGAAGTAITGIWGGLKTGDKYLGGLWADPSAMYNSGYSWGSGLVDEIGGLQLGLPGESILGQFRTDGGVNVAGGDLDSVGSIKNDVNIKDEDIQLLRDMAARDYLLNLQQITPVAHISFGDVRETADVNKIMDVIEDMVEEQMATALVAN